MWRMETKTRLVVDKAKFIPTSDQEVHGAALNTSQGGSRPLFYPKFSWKEDSNHKKNSENESQLSQGHTLGLSIFSRHRRVAHIMAAWLRKIGERTKKWRGNGERMRKWTQNEQIERDSLSTFPHFLFITSLSIHFLSKIVHFYREMLNTALLSWKSQTTQHTLYEKIILGRIRCEKAPQVVISWIPNRDINS